MSASGSRIDRSSTAGSTGAAGPRPPRPTPARVRSGPLVPPAPSARWQLAQPALPLKISLPRAGTPAAAVTPRPGPPAATGAVPGVTPTIERRYATTLNAWGVVKLLGGIAVPGIPD